MSDDALKPLNQPAEIDPNDPLGSIDEMASQEAPAGVDRRAFLMRSALIGATAVILDRPVSAQQRAERLAATPPAPQLSPALNVVKEQKGPVITTLDEFYKVGPVRRVRTPSVPCASPMISASAARSCPPPSSGAPHTGTAARRGSSVG